MSDHPDLKTALDRRLPLEERRRAYRAWAQSRAWHVHPRQNVRHAHPGGNDPYHHHREESQR